MQRVERAFTWIIHDRTSSLSFIPSEDFSPSRGTCFSPYAKQFCLTSDELDKATRVWGAKTADPYHVGLASEMDAWVLTLEHEAQVPLAGRN